jgi:CBS domain-containing protein
MLCPTCNRVNLPGSDVCRNCQQDLTALDRPTAQDRVERSLMEDTVRVLRPRPPVTLPPLATVSDALLLMVEHDIGAVLIVDESGRLAGIFSERDLLDRAVGRDGYGALPLRDVMTPGPEGVRLDDTLAFALHKMDGGGYRHLPVLEGGRPVGMVSVRDLLRHMTGLCRGC